LSLEKGFNITPNLSEPPSTKQAPSRDRTTVQEMVLKGKK